MSPTLITLTTDFGYKDPFVGTMKGVIFGINPDAHIIDLCHGIPPQDLTAAALVLRSAVPFFPRGSIHMAVIDPGVGSSRKPLLIESEGSFFVGPDNGIFGPVLKGKETGQIVELSNESYHLKPTSSTFHGRDIFAPAAARLSLGVPPQSLGTKVKGFEKLDWPEVVKIGNTIEGEVLYIDGFGNLITNVQAGDLNGLQSIQSEKLLISLGAITIRGLASNYATAREGEYVALIDSWGLLEISIFKGNAALDSRAQKGDPVRIERRRELNARPDER